MEGNDRFIREPEMLEIAGLSRDTVRRMEKLGKFPRRIKISSGTIAWRLSELMIWVAEQK